jgi:long-chain-fatty-acid--CoA ligase ACSBG
LRDVRPTFFLGVPRVYEKIEEKLKSVAATKPGWMQAISGWAKRIGTQASDAMIKSQWPPFCFIPANLLILRNIKKAVGVDKVKAFTVGAAPMAKSTLEYFLSLNWIIVNMYGMSECGGPTTGSSLINANLFSAGYAFPGTQLLILDEKGNRLPTGERGEICFTGRNKFMGYYRNPESTRETIDVNGFIHSGDEGLIEADGSLHITGRFKELIITAGGENVPPVLIENDIKGRCRLINNVFVVGDNKKYLAALVTLKNEMDPLSGPSNVLSEESKAILASIGSSATDLQTAVVCEKVHKLVGEAITAYNEEGAISRA